MNPGSLTSDIVLPDGWEECWDSDTGYVYFHHAKSNAIQWTHPSGLVLDDPGLVFRKKRYKLLHELALRLPLPSNYATDVLRFTVSRKNILRDSVHALGNVPLNNLSKRTVVSFENEDGIDSGGLTAEWYMHLSRSFLFKDALLFKELDNGLYTIADTNSAALTATSRSHL